MPLGRIARVALLLAVVVGGVHLGDGHAVELAQVLGDFELVHLWRDEELQHRPLEERRGLEVRVAHMAHHPVGKERHVPVAAKGAVLSFGV